MRVKIRCSNCEQLLLVREEELGRKGRCPACKQEIALEPQKKQPAAVPAPGRAGASREAAPSRRETGIPLASEPRPSPATAPVPPQPPEPGEAMTLAVEELEEDVARRELTVKGTISTAVSGPAPLGRPRSAGLMALACLVLPPFAVYWYITARGQLIAHGKVPAAGAAKVALGVLFMVLTAGVGAWIYCCYLFPSRLAHTQAACGDPNRVSPPTCLFLGILPVIGLALDVLILQGALNRHWKWHEERGNNLVTAGLAA